MIDRSHLVVLLMLSLLLILSGCASRTIDLYEYGIYKSSMNSELEQFELIIDKPDGTHIYVSIGRSISDPAETTEAQAEVLRDLIPSIVEGVLRGMFP